MKRDFFFRQIDVNQAIFTNLVANSSRTLELDIKKDGMTSIKCLAINTSKMTGTKLYVVSCLIFTPSALSFPGKINIVYDGKSTNIVLNYVSMIKKHII